MSRGKGSKVEWVVNLWVTEAEKTSLKAEAKEAGVTIGNHLLAGRRKPDTEEVRTPDTERKKEEDHLLLAFEVLRAITDPQEETRCACGARGVWQGRHHISSCPTCQPRVWELALRILNDQGIVTQEQLQRRVLPKEVL